MASWNGVIKIPFKTNYKFPLYKNKIQHGLKNSYKFSHCLEDYCYDYSILPISELSEKSNIITLLDLSYHVLNRFIYERVNEDVKVKPVHTLAYMQGVNSNKTKLSKGVDTHGK